MLPIDLLALREIWIPTEEAQPDNQTIVRIIEFLNTHPTFLSKHPNELKPYLKILEKVNLEKIPEKAAKIYSILLEKYSHFFPEGSQDVSFLTIKMGNREVQVPKSHVLIQSKKFRTMLNSQMQEGKSNVLTIDVGNYDPEAIEAFISYLKTGEAQIDDENVWELYHLSDEHFFDNLKEHCTNFIEQQVDVDNWEAIFDLSKDTHNPKMMLSCLNFIVENREEPDIERLSEKSKNFLAKHPHLIPQLLALKIPDKIDLYKKISNTKEIILTSDNFLTFALISSWIGHEELSQACISFVSQNLTVETLPKILKEAVDLGLKDIVWKCFKFAKAKNMDLSNNEKLQGKPYDDFAILIKAWREIILHDQTGAIVCYSSRPPEFFKYLSVIGNLCSYFKVHLKIPSSYISLKDLETQNPLPITSLAIHSSYTFDELSPFLNKNPTIREFTNYSEMMGDFSEIQEYASHFYPSNKESKIKLTGIHLGEQINDQELASFLDDSPFISFLTLDASKITKIPQKDGLKTLICENLSLEEFIPQFPIPNISVRNCPNLKTINAKESKNIMLVNNPELISLNFDKPERIYSYKCKKLNIDKTAVEPDVKILVSSHTTPYIYNQLTTYFY